MDNTSILSPECVAPEGERTNEPDMRIDPDGNTYRNSDDDDCTVLREVSAC